MAWAVNLSGSAPERPESGENQDMPLLFVYGTLRSGEPAHRLLEGCHLVGEFETVPAYDLLDLGPFPGLAEGGATAVKGEVYEIADEALPALDAYEDCPRLFYRGIVRLRGETEAQAYLIRRERLAPRFHPIRSGDWKARGGF